MKKLYFLMAFALCSFGAWADDAVKLVLNLNTSTGKFYDTSGTEVTSLSESTAYASWAYSSTTDANNVTLPEGFSLTLASTEAAIYYDQTDDREAYSYGSDTKTGCLWLSAHNAAGYDYTLTVPEGYYILSYDLGINAWTINNVVTATNWSGSVSTVSTGSFSKSTIVTLHGDNVFPTTSFHLQSANTTTNYGRACMVNFQVCVVNQAYIDANSEEIKAHMAKVPVDFTLDFHYGTGAAYTNATSTDALAYNSYGAIAKYTAGGLPINCDFTLTAPSNGSVGILQSSLYGTSYHYLGTTKETFCCTPCTTGGYTMTVPEGYYILQYQLGFNGTTSSATSVVTAENGSSQTLPANSNTGAGKDIYNITDTPVAQSTTFTVTSSGSCSANFRVFKVRIVNKKYIDTHKQYALGIVEADFRDEVGYPKSTTDAYTNLSTAISAAKTGEEITDAQYKALLNAYSAYCSETDVNLPEDCKVYTLTFIDTKGGRWYLNQGTSGAELIAYPTKTITNDEGTENTVYVSTAELPTTARWISHKVTTVADDGTSSDKFVFVNKGDGKYLQAIYSGNTTGTSDLYHAEWTSFEIKMLSQNMSTYMRLATDELLLGAVYLKSDYRTSGNSTACTLSMSLNGETAGWGVASAAFFGSNLDVTGLDSYTDAQTTYSSAVLIETVNEGDTYNNVKFQQPVTETNKFSTFYTFYPTAVPTDTKVYYCTTSETEGYLHMTEWEGEIIPRNMPVVMEYSGTDEAPTHMHIGLMETEVTNPTENLLKGTVVEKATSTESGQVYAFSGAFSEGLGFYKYTAANLPIGKAYYVNNDAQAESIRGFLLTTEDGEVTVIDAATMTAQPAAVYDLCGRRVQKAGKGIYVVNGKKVIK